MIRLIQLDSTGSTNSYLASLVNAPHGTVVSTREQTAGRGQRGNSWEASAGLNVTMSILLRPEGLEARRQFLISQAVSMATVELLDSLLPSATVSVKWPNDIYVGDRKICGILIENDLNGRLIGRSIAGIGLNVNQPKFLSSAPNPVSLFQLTGHTFDVDRLTAELATRIVDRLDSALSSPDEATLLATHYFNRLWRASGWWPFRDNLRGLDMTARISDVAPDGLITLIDRDNLTPRTYAFKEISFLL